MANLADINHPILNLFGEYSYIYDPTNKGGSLLVVLSVPSIGRYDGMMVAGRFGVLPHVVGKLEQNWNWDFVLLGNVQEGLWMHLEGS